MLPRASTWSPSGVKGASTSSGQEKHPFLPPRPEKTSPGIGNSRHAQLPSPTPDTTDSEANSFKEDIHIFDGSKYIPAVALLDTLCEAYICISKRLVEDLGLTDEVSSDYNFNKRITDANGQDVEICGSLTLYWKIFGGHTVHKDDFLVLWMEDLDVVIGKGKIVAGKLLTYNKNALKPMLAHNKMTLGEKAKQALLEEEQRQAKAALETQRLNAENSKQQKSAQTSRG